MKHQFKLKVLNFKNKKQNLRSLMIMIILKYQQHVQMKNNYYLKLNSAQTQQVVVKVGKIKRIVQNQRKQQTNK